ncbi:MAG: hypothetical protein ACON4U_15045 [Myxococcota bacterium]
MSINDYCLESQHPTEIHTLTPSVLPYSSVYKGAVSVDVVHDGNCIPHQFMVNGKGEPHDEKIIGQHYVLERDWGANIVAKKLSETLALDSFFTVNIARCLLDFGRFPGITKQGASHLGRFAINQPFATLLNYQQKQYLLESYYDVISKEMEHYLQNRLLKIAIHTYDPYNASGTLRPEVSLVTRMLGYQLESRMPIGVFDPLYPDILAEFTVDRILRDRISLTLEKQGIPVAHNYPYLLPEGSIEVRHQVWRFFKWLQAHFEKRFPQTVTKESYQSVWNMLQDTNLRSAEASTLRSVLHLFRRPPEDSRLRTNAAVQAYHHIADFVHTDNDAVVEEYRLSPDRCMALGIEIRKDLVWKLDSKGAPIELAPERGLYIAEQIGKAIITYLNEDRSQKISGRVALLHQLRNGE